jgi:N-acyl-D-amino-acid deacylase
MRSLLRRAAMADAPDHTFDLLVRGGSVHDGNGGEPRAADIGVIADRIAEIGDLSDARAGTILEASGMAVAPGFINVLSHSYITMLHDGRSMGELKQGVTTQIFGEGYSMGPIKPETRRWLQKWEPELNYDVNWLGLREYLETAEMSGVSQNVASFIGATTLRMYVAGEDDRPLTGDEMETVRALVREEMSAGAIGIGSSLIYPPAFFASTEELIEMCRAAAPYGGRYISHMRSESEGLIDTGLAELIRIAREAEVPAEAFHLKAAGKDAWHLMGAAIDCIDDARAQGLAVTADMYTYTAGATGLSNCIPPWYHDGGQAALIQRLQDPIIRGEIRQQIESGAGEWENLYHRGGSPENVLILQVRNPELRWCQGKTLGQIAAARGTDPIETIFDLVTEDRSRITTAYFMMSEENVKLGLKQPWVSLGSDSPSTATEGEFLQRSTHPRAYGNFARFLGKYVREERLVPLGEAVRKMSALPADNLGLKDRGRLEPGRFADIVVFDAETVADRATYEDPHQYAVGVRDVVVNGQVALRDGEFAGNYPGRALRASP